MWQLVAICLLLQYSLHGKPEGGRVRAGRMGNLEGEVSLTCDNSIIKRAYQVEQNLPVSSSQHPPLYPSSMQTSTHFLTNSLFTQLTGLQLFRYLFILSLDGHYLKCTEYFESQFANIPCRVAFCKWLSYPFYAGVFIHFILKNSLQNVKVSYTRLNMLNTSISSNKI